ncbi:MAG: Gfo/Idh/MocA family oxidoreductase [Candidatus Njordarchaeia archaeon]
MTGVGIVGIGGWGKNHVRVISQLKALGYIDYIGIADVDESLLKFYSKLYQIDFAANNLDDLVRRDEIDALIIATPTPLHYEHALLALKNDLHVLVEKPLTANTEEALKLINFAKEKKKVLMVGFLLRYSPAVRYVKEIIASGELGRIISISAKRTSLWPKRKMDVSIIKDLAIHDIDLVRFITGIDPKNVLAYGGRKLHEYEDHVTMLIEYSDAKNPIPALIEASWITPYKIRRIEITGDKGSAELELLEHKVTLFFEDKILTPILEKREPLFEEDKNFILSMQGEEKPLVVGYDGYIALKTCEAAHLSIKEKEIIEVK